MYLLSDLIDASLEDVLEHQYGALARWQAKTLGLSDDAFDRRLRSGAFELRHKGVAVAQAWRHHELAPLAAAVLRGGPGAHLALWTAAKVLDVDLRGDSDLRHLWVPHLDRRPSPAAGLELRRSRLLSAPLDVTVRRNLPLTTVERAVVDRFARPMRARDREALLADLLQKRRTCEQRLTACAARGLEGSAVLRELLGVVSGHDSGLEVELHRLAAQVGIACEPLVTVVHPDGTRDEVDLLGASVGMVLEADGWAFHSSPEQREADELKDERLRRHGLVVLRFTHRQVHVEPETSRRRLATEAEGRLWTPPPGVRLEYQQATAAA